MFIFSDGNESISSGGVIYLASAQNFQGHSAPTEVLKIHYMLRSVVTF